MAGEVEQLRELMSTDEALAGEIATQYTTWRIQRSEKEKEWLEVRNYVHATDTTTTTNSQNEHSNKTTIPKLTQIRDNLHANYLAALIPNADWLRWEGYSEDSDVKEKRIAIQAYMDNKIREGDLRQEISKILYDYIDNGNCFAEAIFEANFKIDEETEERIPQFIGPKLKRISPYDIVFNITASNFESSPKIIRYLKSIGEMISDSETADLSYFKDIIPKVKDFREVMTAFPYEDIDKAIAIEVDGFGTYSEYLSSGYVEILRFLGDIYDPDTDTYLRDYEIIVVDRKWIATKRSNPSWLGKPPIHHVSWRERPDNLMGSGPLDNLVGMQYRLDHLENLKADAFDQYIYPPLEIRGDFEPFEWGPGAIAFNPDGDGQLVIHRPDASVLQVNNEIGYLMALMEEMAGAPKEAAGIRTPGEKTKFEVQQLQNAAGRIFQDKITKFELNFLEPALNSMLETARRNMQGADIIRVMDDDLGVSEFINITKADITATGKIRPIGARHFAAEAQRVQNLTQISMTPIWQQIAPHISSKALAKMVEDLLQFERFDLVTENIAVFEQAETQRLVNAAQDMVDVESLTPGIEPPVA